MSRSTLTRVAPLSGVAFAALLIAGVIVIGNYDFLPSAADLVSFFSANSGSVTTGAYLALLGAAFLAVFAGSVAGRIRAADGGFLADVVLAGGAASAATIGVGWAVMPIAAERATSAGGLDPATAVSLFDVYSSMAGSVLPMLSGALVAAAGLAALSTRVLPGWLGIVSLLLALALVSPVGYLAVAGLALWVPVVGIALYIAPEPATEVAVAR